MDVAMVNFILLESRRRQKLQRNIIEVFLLLTERLKQRKLETHKTHLLYMHNRNEGKHDGKRFQGSLHIAPSMLK